ncbi:hypothetical protein K501DRAFT_298533 [Backusella circina FSU 941]|nr:hypothetical protein K501DRAFT_298533 [Backusella circina FSU 941]
MLEERMQLDEKRIQIEESISEKQQEIDTKNNQTLSLQHDLKVLKTKCQDETSQIQDIYRSKENLKRELEELGQKLMEEANLMVTLEREEMKTIKETNDQLESALKEATTQLTETERELEELRQLISRHKEQIASSIYQHPSIDSLTRARIELSVMHGRDIGVAMEAMEDEGALMDFNDFYQTASKTPLRKLHSLKYLKYCIRDDVEPCLRFGPNPRLSSRKIMDAILVKTCLVEECPEGFATEQAIRQVNEEAVATLWERFTSSSVFLGCQACGRRVESRERELKYRFRISYFDEWACIDRYCRDRLLAVIEFYAFIRHLRAGGYKHRSLHELYQEFIRLKLQMFITRMGSLPDMLNSCGIDSLKLASAFHGESNNSVILSESNFERLSSSTESSITVSTVDSARTSASST